jgi:hypothetical protein
LQGTNPYDAPDDEFLCSSLARKPRVQSFQPDLDDDDEELSDYVKTRLLIARARAMAKYKETRA